MIEGQLGSEISWFKEYNALPFPTEMISSTWKKIRRCEKLQLKTSVNLILCSDYRIKKLNFKYRGKDKSTDVLSFCFDDPEILGEIYISLQRAAVQARRFGVSYESELNRLYVHGMFHLLGYDHVDENDRAVMEKKESRYI